MIAGILRSTYEPIFALDLQTASPAQFNERFRQTFPAKDEVLRKCITFFLNAAREADIPISPYILKNKKPRSTPAKKRARPENGGSAKPGDTTPPNPAGARQNQRNENPESPPVGRTPFQVLMQDIYDPAAMDGEQEAAVFTLARFLKIKEAEK